MKYNRIVISRIGGPEVLQLIEDILSEPGPEEVWVRVLASGVAFGDTLKRQGIVPGMPRIPYTPGYDFTGVVERCGIAVRGVSVGDRVCAFVGNGGNAEWIRVRADRLVKLPDSVKTEDAACLSLNYVTAHQMLHRIARVKPGARILVHGAAGGAGSALLQLGKIAGLRMYGTASKAKHGAVEGMGAIPIDYRNEDFVERMKQLEPDGIDAVFDPVGGSHLKRSYSVLSPGGRLVIYGVSSAAGTPRGRKRELLTTFGRLALYRLYQMMPNGKAASFFGIGNTPGSNVLTIREDLTQLVEQLAAGKIQPLIGRRFSLSQAREAHETLEAAAVVGKILFVSSFSSAHN